MYLGEDNYINIRSIGEASGSLRAPIFYDSNDTNYFIDPASTSDSALRMRGGALFGPNTTWGAYLYVGGNGRVGTSASVAVTNGNLHLDSQNGYALYLNWYSTNNIYTQANLGIGSDSASYRLHVHGTGYATSDFRAPIFYDSNNTSYYVDPAEGGFNLRGGSSNRVTYSTNDSGFLVQNPEGVGGNVRLGAAWGRLGIYNGSYLMLGSEDYIEFRTQNVQRGYMDNSANLYAFGSVRAPIFYDSNDTTYYLDPNSTTSSLKIAGAIELGENHAFPNIEWSSSGTSTGMVIFKLPGGSGNYGMVHMVFDYYEYDSPRTATIIVSGHNWNTGWYNNSCNVVGFIDKQVRLGFKDGQYCVVIGTSGSGWNYGTVRLRKIHNGSFYNAQMDLGGSYSVTQTTTESFTNITGDLRNFRTPTALQVDGILYAYTDVRTPVVYDQNDTGYYSDPNSVSQFWRINASNYIYSSNQMYSTIMYDTSDTGYYCDPNGSSRLNDVFPNQIYNYGWFRNQSSATGLYNTATDSHFYSAGPNYWHINPDNGSVSAGGLIFYDQYNSTQGGETGRRGYVYWDGSGFGLVNGADGDWAVSVHTTNHKRVTIGGNQSLNAYGSKDGIRLMFGGGNDDAAGNYYIGTNFENYGGSYTKLDLRWHTGIRMGAQPGYGGIRFYDNEDLGTVRFSINKGDEHTRVESGSFYSNLMYDRDNTAYYVDPASTSRLLKLRVNTANDPSDNVFGTAADIPLLVAGSTRTQSTFLIENFSNSSLEYPTIVLRRTLPAAANRFGSLLRFADKDTNNNEISAQIYTFNRLTYQDLTVESGGTNDRVILRAGASSNIIVGENYVTHIKAANYSVTTPGALDIDCRQGNYFTKTIAGDSTFTFSNVTSLSGYTLAYSFTLELTHTSGTVTWPASVKWPGNTAPSLTTGKTHLFMFVTDDAGSRWRGSYLTNYDN
jgi:hypothetical protein